jgi:cellulose synthase/poly-beta-1,6-N-acetylglucosamine synthase-like glycosyltransferase
MWTSYITLSLTLMSAKLALENQFSELYLLDAPKINLGGFLFTLYLMLIMTIIFISIQSNSRTLSKPSKIGEGSSYIRFLFKFCTHFQGFLSLCVYALIFYMIFLNKKYLDFQNIVVFSLIANVGIHVGLIILNTGCLLTWKILISSVFTFPFYLYFSPTYINTFMIFSFCNIDDCSWGTKGNYDVDKMVIFLYFKF